MPSEPPKPQRQTEARTPGFDEAKPTPSTPSTRDGWDADRHRDSIEFFTAQDQRPGARDETARRNQFCPKCRGVVDWTAVHCPHCDAEIPRALRDYYNFSDFEAPVDRRDLGPILTALALLVLLAAAAIGGAIVLVRWIVG